MSMVAPVSGRVVAMADVPDPVFAQEIVGPGVAVEPVVDGAVADTAGAADAMVVAPVAGTVASLFPHAFALQTPGGRTVLVHLGIDTVSLKGEGFTVHVAVGDEVVAGQHLLTWDPAAVAAAGLATVCPVVALQGEPAQVAVLVAPGALVRRGDPLLTWSSRG